MHAHGYHGMRPGEKNKRTARLKRLNQRHGINLVTYERPSLNRDHRTIRTPVNSLDTSENILNITRWETRNRRSVNLANDHFLGKIHSLRSGDHLHTGGPAPRRALLSCGNRFKVGDPGRPNGT